MLPVRSCLGQKSYLLLEGNSKITIEINRLSRLLPMLLWLLQLRLLEHMHRMRRLLLPFLRELLPLRVLLFFNVLLRGSWTRVLHLEHCEYPHSHSPNLSGIYAYYHALQLCVHGSRILGLTMPSWWSIGHCWPSYLWFRLSARITTSTIVPLCVHLWIWEGFGRNPRGASRNGQVISRDVLFDARECLGGIVS